MPLIKYIALGFVSVLFMFSAAPADAAVLELFPSANRFGIGESFSVDLKADSEGESINAAQVTVHFPVGILEVTGVDKAGSVYNFWLEEPVFSNEDGTVRFVGGTQKGVSGGSLQVLRVNFKTKGAGLAELAFADSAVIASDGRGTNVLKKTVAASVSIGTQAAAAPLPPAATSAVPVEVPQKVVREAVIAEGLPAKPKLRSPLYPDENQWYNRLGEVFIFWDLTSDITSVSTRLSRAPDSLAGKTDSELFTGKSFGILKDGVWYVRAQFRNSAGLGPRAYYKISLDTAPPLPFQIQLDEAVSDNPVPEIRFETSDSLSGMSGYTISVDGREVMKTSSGTAALPPQLPGKHVVTARAFDLAGNSVEDSKEFEVLPLPTPTIGFITRAVSEGEVIFVSGKALPGGLVDAAILDDTNQETFRGVAETSGSGDWQITVDKQLPRGSYSFVASARDARGAVSHASAALGVEIKERPVLSFGPLSLSFLEVIFVIFLLAALLLAIAFWYRAKEKSRREAYGTIAVRDIEKLSVLLENDLKSLREREGALVSGQAGAKEEADVIAKKLAENITKLRKYLGEEVNKLK